MSEQALRAVPSGTSSSTGTAATGTYTVLANGKSKPASGKELPTVKVEKPDLEELAQQLNSVSRTIGRDLRFQVDIGRGNAVLQVLDRETGEIIRQIPHEKASVGVSYNGAVHVKLFDDMI